MVKKYIYLTIFLLGISIVYNMFIIPIHLVSGGTGGLGVLLNKVLGIEPFAVIFFVSSLMFLLSALFLDLVSVFSTLYVVIVYPLLVKLVSFINFSDIFTGEDTLTLVLISAIITGFFQGLIFKMGFNIGGFSVIGEICNKYFKTSVTFVNFVINSLIVIIGAFIFGISNLLYALVYLIILRFISERVILGTSRNKTLKIISSKYKDIEDFIHDTLLHDTTIYKAYGVFKDSNIKLIMTTIPNRDLIILKEYVKSIDRHAFIFITDTYEALGQDVLIKESVK